MLVEKIDETKWGEAQDAEFGQQKLAANNPRWEWNLFRYYYMLLFGDWLERDWAGKTVMEIGVGTGGVLWKLNAKTKYAVEPLAKKLLAINSRMYPDDYHVFSCAAEDLNDYTFNERLDGVLCLNVLDHCRDPKIVLDKMYRCLRPGGSMALCCDLKSQEAHLDTAHPIALSYEWFDAWVDGKKWRSGRIKAKVRSRSMDNDGIEQLDGTFVFIGERA